MISERHHNRRAHNWLVYEIGERHLQKYAHMYTGTLYDLGCGTSPYRDFFLAYAHRYIGVDWSGSIHDTRADIAADLNQPLPIQSDIADTVVSLSVLEHLSEPQQMLYEAFRILKPGGSIILQVPWQWWIHEAPHDYFRYTPYGLKHLFSKAGFVDIKVEPQSGFFTTWILKFNYFTNRLVRGPKVVRWFIRTPLSVLWFLGQTAAPWLDKIDRHWELESCGYYVTARKA